MAQSLVVLVAPGPDQHVAAPALSFMCALRTSRQLAREGIPHVSVLGANAVQNIVQTKLSASGIIGLDFYGHGTPTALVGNDSRDLLTAASRTDLSLLAGKGIDILGCNAGSHGGLADSAVSAGAKFVICYSREAVVIGTAEDMRAMTVSKLSLYHRATAQGAYEAQKNAMRERARLWQDLNPAMRMAMQRNLACYELLGDANASWS
jgi:hypothetical protein